MPLQDVTELAASETLRVGKDEMNLVEHPFASLWKNESSDAVILQEWETTHPISGKKVKASWRVAGDPEHGLPTPTDERVYLVMMELSREQDFSQTVAFTRHDILKRLGWQDNDKHYAMLLDAFRRLKSVTISAENAFWDAERKSFRDVGFSLIDNYDLVREKPGRKKCGEDGRPAYQPGSAFKWNDAIYRSVKNGFIRTLDLEFALSLKGSITLRLYRYLDKKSYAGTTGTRRREFEIELRLLCETHLGMAHTRYPSTLKSRLEGAHQELQSRGFLESVTFAPMKSRTGEKVIYRFSAREGVLPPDSALAVSPPEPLSEDEGHAVWSPEEQRLLERMADISVSLEVARELLRTVPADQLAMQLDCLSDREPKNPPATFVKAVREVWAMPQTYVERLEAAERAEKARTHKESRNAQKRAEEALKRQERASALEESARLDAAYLKLGERNRSRVDEEAMSRLGVVGQLRSSEGAKAAMRRQVLREMLNPAPATSP